MKLGRQPRKFDPRIPHLSAMMAKKRVAVLAPPLPAVSWSTMFGPSFSFGMMLNDVLGDCTNAGIYHARQIWTGNANPPTETISDDVVKQTYEKTCGYNPADPNTDQGGVEQDVLKYWLNVGVQTLAGIDKLAAFFEVDVRNQDDIRRTIDWCGGCYIGMQVPRFIMENIPDMWTPQSTNNDLEGGHCVYVTGYDTMGIEFISWGKLYRMTWGYFSEYVDEAYGLVDRAWINKTGKTPIGFTLEELEGQMVALKTA